MKKNNNFYVVWVGKKTGVFNSWDECKEQIFQYKDAKYKAYKTIEEAKKAYLNKEPQNNEHSNSNNIILDSICVDAACSVEKQIMEYRGVFNRTKKVLFHKGPFYGASNNIGEFLAIIHAMAYMKNNNLNYPIYTDSMTAISWVVKKQTRHTIEVSKEVDLMIEKAINWLNTNNYSNYKILKWDTKNWGEIPADFGRK